MLAQVNILTSSLERQSPRGVTRVGFRWERHNSDVMGLILTAVRWPACLCAGFKLTEYEGNKEAWAGSMFMEAITLKVSL